MRQTLAAAVLLPIIQYLIVGLIYIGLPFWVIYSKNSASFFRKNEPAQSEFTQPPIEPLMEESLSLESLDIPNFQNLQKIGLGEPN